MKKITMHDKKYSGIDRLPKGAASEKLIPACLVLEGGAFRGVYGEGVLDALLMQGLNFETVIGCSAGALNGTQLISGQIGRCAAINLTFRHDPRYIGLTALHRSGSPISLDFLLKDVNRYYPLDRKRFEQSNQRFVVNSTSCLTGESVYSEKGVCSDIFAAIKASASMPYVSPMVNVDGVPCLDGGCRCKIPYRWAMKQGYDKIVVIRTRNWGYRKPVSFKSLRIARDFYGKKYPAFAERLGRSSAQYNVDCEKLEQLHKSGRLFALTASEPVDIGRVEGDMEKLGAAYWKGYRDGLHQMDALMAYLEK